MKKTSIYQLILASIFVAIGLLLPTIFHSFGLLGPVFLPMHIPVLLCGLLCGWKYGGAVGFIVPLLSFIFTGMPPLFPVGISMMFELATYGIVAGLLIKKTNVFVSLIAAMLAGRIVSALANVILLGFSQKVFTTFLAGAFVTALPGIIVQIIIIPIIILALNKGKFLKKAN